MSCFGCSKLLVGENAVPALGAEHELVAAARRLIKTASDPFTACINFLHDRRTMRRLPDILSIMFCSKLSAIRKKSRH